MIDISTARELTLAWLADHGFAIALILVGAWVVNRFSGAFIDRLIRRAVAADARGGEESERKREDTLIRITTNTMRTLVWLLTGLMVLSELGVNIGPLLAAAGVAGLALGFGGQYLIRDVITGLFIVLENQYRVNDVVCFDGTCGLVEDISLRMTVLRDLDGTVHHVPHGEVKKVSNLSKYYARVNLNVSVSYASDLEHVIAVVNKVGAELAADSAWQPFILKPPQFLRVDAFADSGIIVKILGDTKPLKQWDVTGELRKRLKIAFDQEGIVIPFQQVTIHQAA